MKLAICTKFQIVSKVEEGGGVRLNPPPPPSRLRVSIFSRRLLGLIQIIHRNKNNLKLSGHKQLKNNALRQNALVLIKKGVAEE